jgi:small ligand-binding sensory domain FIST
VLGVDRATGAVAVGDSPAVGSTVPVARSCSRATDAVGGCSARPTNAAIAVGDLLGTSAVAGMYCAGELGPVGGRNAVHGFPASIAIL